MTGGYRPLVEGEPATPPASVPRQPSSVQPPLVPVAAGDVAREARWLREAGHTFAASLLEALWKQGEQADELTSRAPGLDLDALERAHTRVLALWKACLASGRTALAAEWEALLVASGYGWPAAPRQAEATPPQQGPVVLDLDALEARLDAAPYDPCPTRAEWRALVAGARVAEALRRSHASYPRSTNDAVWDALGAYFWALEGEG